METLFASCLTGADNTRGSILRVYRHAGIDCITRFSCIWWGKYPVAITIFSRVASMTHAQARLDESGRSCAGSRMVRLACTHYSSRHLHNPAIAFPSDHHQWPAYEARSPLAGCSSGLYVCDVPGRGVELAGSWFWPGSGPGPRTANTCWKLRSRRWAPRLG